MKNVKKNKLPIVPDSRKTMGYSELEKNQLFLLVSTAYKTQALSLENAAIILGIPPNVAKLLLPELKLNE